MNERIKGAILVALGATSYGILTTIVKIAYAESFTAAEVTVSQLTLGFIITLILSFFNNHKSSRSPHSKEIGSLILAGTSLGLTSVFYYQSVRYVDVSVAIVLLMQSVWIGIIIESIVDRTMPSLSSMIAILLIFIGTLFGTNIFIVDVAINTTGLIYGLLAGLSFAITIFASQRIAQSVPAIIRSRYLLTGGLIIVCIIYFQDIINDFNKDIFTKWGIILALFGTVIPPILLTKGMPKISVGLGAIISSLELPVAIIMAAIILKEEITHHQWIGAIVIILAIILANYRHVRSTG